jgi:hypothetical protein
MKKDYCDYCGDVLATTVRDRQPCCQFCAEYIDYEEKIYQTRLEIKQTIVSDRKYGLDISERVLDKISILTGYPLPGDSPEKPCSKMTKEEVYQLAKHYLDKDLSNSQVDWFAVFAKDLEERINLKEECQHHWKFFSGRKTSFIACEKCKQPKKW